MILDDLISLFYPRLCAGCRTPLVRGEEVICLNCLADLPRTRYPVSGENPVFQLFTGRVQIEMATSFCFFDKGGRLQRLLHQLKYKGNSDVGYKLGLIFGNELKVEPRVTGIDIILPVPLHPRKEKIRGFNQSAELARGLSESLGRPLLLKNLIRDVNTETQTRKGRFERWENVSGIFSLQDGSFLSGKHILLVDDVLTTGATLEACSIPLLEVPGLRLSIVTLACA